MKCGGKAAIFPSSFVLCLPGLLSCSWKTTVRAASEGPTRTLVFTGGRPSSPLGTETDVNLGLPSDLQGFLESTCVYTDTEPSS